MSEIVERKLVRSWPKWFQRLGIIVACPGCQYGIAARLLCECLDEMDIGGKTIGVVGIGCHSGAMVLIQTDLVQAAHGRACDVATAIKRVSRGKPIVFTWQGDGDALAIGTESTIQAAVRGERITVFVINNCNYGTTGGQMSPTSLIGQKTTTTPYGRDPRVEGYPFYAPEYMAVMKGVVYAARGAVNTPANCQRTKEYIRKALQKQIDDIGFSYVEILSACPPDWHLTPLECQERIANEVIPSFPLGEFKDVDQLE
jgi:2-oxoglutarate ferredoxin oxidoreductase subunit beta